MKAALCSSRAALCAVISLFNVHFVSSALSQATNSTNIAGTNNVLQATASNSVLLGGQNNVMGGTNGGVVAGANGRVSSGAVGAFIGGGNVGLIGTNANLSVVLGGLRNTVTNNSQRSAIVGGFSNVVASVSSGVVGGESNLVVVGANRAFIGGGQFNEVRAPGGAVVGGFANEAAGTNSFAAGSQAVASNTGTFVWADMSSPTDFVSTGNNQFLIRANGGVGINTANPQGNALFVSGNLRVTGRIVSENNQVSTPGAAVAGGRGNLATNNFTFVGGGENNIAGGIFSIVVGGGENTNRGGGAFIGGGFANSVANGSSGSVIGGGSGNRITATNIASPQNFEAAATIAGGARNEAAGYRSTVGGGEDNRAGAAHDVVAGGRANAAHGGTSAILGGFENAITNSSESAIVGGFQNLIHGGSSGIGRNNFIGGGAQNTNRGSFATIGGGEKNTIVSSSSGSVIAGGISNRVTATNATSGSSFLPGAATVGGGKQNTASGSRSTVAGGNENTASGSRSTVAGGTVNTASGSTAAVLGGGLNTASGVASAVAGGSANTNSGSGGFIGAGDANTIRAAAADAVVGGGKRNVAAGIQATIPGGSNNLATNNSFAAGVRAKADDTNSFVWGGADAVDTTSVAAQSFTVRAPGGARFITTLATTGISGPFGVNGVILGAGGTAWQSLSDSNSKTDFEAVKPREILSKVAALPVTSWHYKHDLKRRYIGPTAQDFHAAFGLGSDDKSISTLDSDGVMYAAIQGLVEELKARDAKHAKDLSARDQTIEELKAKLEAVEQRLSALPPTP